MNIGALSIEKKTITLVLTVVSVVVGALAYQGLGRLEDPQFTIKQAIIFTPYPGASAEDVERSITIPLEQALRNTDGLEKMSSTSSQGTSVISLEFPEDTDMGAATDRVEELVGSVRNLPSDAEDTEVTHVVRYEPVSRLLVHGPGDIRELRPLVRRMERELLDRGIAKVEITGLPEDELAVQIPQATLEDLGLSLREVAVRIAAESRDLPAGTVG